LHLINGQQVRELLPMQRCIELMEHALRLVTDQRTRQPLRSWLQPPGVAGVMALMPGYLPEPAALGVKVISVFAGNFARGLPSHQGAVMLFDAAHGEPLALIDARAVTAIRTAAASAVATRLLAAADARTLGLCGYGEQAASHLEALSLVRPFERILVWGRDHAKCRAFAEQHSGDLDIAIEPVDSAQAAASADVICTLTSSSQPVVLGRWLRPGQHLNLVGASLPHAAEVDAEALVRARYFVDFRDSALAFAGELRLAREAGLIAESHLLGSLGEVLQGTLTGRGAPEDLTIFKSLGMIAEDLVACDFVLREAQRLGVGEHVHW